MSGDLYTFSVQRQTTGVPQFNIDTGHLVRSTMLTVGYTMIVLRPSYCLDLPVPLESTIQRHMWATCEVD